MINGSVILNVVLSKVINDENQRVLRISVCLFLFLSVAKDPANRFIVMILYFYRSKGCLLSLNFETPHFIPLKIFRNTFDYPPHNSKTPIFTHLKIKSFDVTSLDFEVWEYFFFLRGGRSPNFHI